MGYTHYWKRPEKLDEEKFQAAIVDCGKIIQAVEEIGVRIAGWDGKGNLILTADEIRFNGDVNCGHDRKDLCIPWPSDNAGGVDPEAHADGAWFAGATIPTRTCDGDCSYETFAIPRVFVPEKWQTPENQLYFACCKTAFRPYDLAVTACLIVFKHHFGERFQVSSDGEDQHWFDAKLLCDQILGYGLAYEVREGCLTSKMATAAA